MNVNVEAQPIPGILGIYREQVITNNGSILIVFSAFNELKFMNTVFYKKDTTTKHDQ